MFDFAANTGKTFHRGEDKAAEKPKQHIEKNNLGFSDLIVAVQEETVMISGRAKDTAGFEKVMLIAGNVEGVAHVEAAGLGAAGDSGFVVVKSRAPLWEIAGRELASGVRYTEIFTAKREVIEDPDLIFPGQKIRIPKG